MKLASFKTKMEGGENVDCFQNNGIYMLHWFQGKSLSESSVTSVPKTA